MVIALLGVTVPQIEMAPTNNCALAQLTFNNGQEMNTFINHMSKQQNGSRTLQINKDLVVTLDYPGCSNPTSKPEEEK